MRFACWDMLCTFNIDNLEVEANNVWHDKLQQVLKITVFIGFLIYHGRS